MDECTFPGVQLSTQVRVTLRALTPERINAHEELSVHEEIASQGRTRARAPIKNKLFADVFVAKSAN